jgi:hypothetical protein
VDAMTGKVIYQPTPEHKCHPGQKDLIPQLYHPGTVWQCQDCNKTWVARDYEPDLFYSLWRPERKRERRKREKL